MTWVIYAGARRAFGCFSACVNLFVSTLVSELRSRNVYASGMW
jgi:hypothetical protein